MLRTGSVRRRLCGEIDDMENRGKSARRSPSSASRSPLFSLSPRCGRSNESMARPPSLVLGDSVNHTSPDGKLPIVPCPTDSSVLLADSSTWHTVEFFVPAPTMNHIKRDSRDRGAAYHTVVFSIFLLTLEFDCALGDSASAGFRILREGMQRRGVSVSADVTTASTVHSLVEMVSSQLLGLLAPESIMQETDFGQDVLFALLPAGGTGQVGAAVDWDQFVKANLIFAIEDVRPNGELRGCLRHRPGRVDRDQADAIACSLASLHENMSHLDTWECGLSDFMKSIKASCADCGETALCASLPPRAPDVAADLNTVNLPAERALPSVLTPGQCHPRYHGHVNANIKVCAYCAQNLCGEGGKLEVFFAYDRMFCSKPCRSHYINVVPQ
jgi:hypothetical protein